MTDEPNRYWDLDRAGRLGAVEESGLLDTPPEAVYDRLTQMVVQILGVPIALITLVAGDRQFFKSQCGLSEPWASLRETPLTHSFCQYVVMSERPLQVADARAHGFLKDNLAIPELGVIAYLGVPLISADGQVWGTLCAIDSEAREWTERDLEILYALAAQVVTEYELRRDMRNLRQAISAAAESEEARKYAINLAVHDLRTPLTSLILSVGMIQITGELNERQRHFAKLAEHNGQVVADMLDDLLEVQRAERLGAASVSESACDPESIIERAKGQVAGLAADGGVDLRISISPETGPVKGDPDLLVRVLVNLMGNAVKFTPEGGRVAVSAAPDRRERSGMVLFEIRDTGGGIGEAEASTVFTEGVHGPTVRSSMRATGLGLTFCKRVVESHGGKIWFTSREGEGTAFFFTVPAKAKGS
jgi:signal transduction histidine kinase